MRKTGIFLVWGFVLFSLKMLKGCRCAQLGFPSLWNTGLLISHILLWLPWMVGFWFLQHDGFPGVSPVTPQIIDDQCRWCGQVWASPVKSSSRGTSSSLVPASWSSVHSASLAMKLGLHCYSCSKSETSALHQSSLTCPELWDSDSVSST